MKLRYLLTLVVALMLMASACSSDDGDDIGAGPIDTEEGAEEEAPAEGDTEEEGAGTGTEGETGTDGETAVAFNECDPAEVDRDATLNYGFYISLSRFDPHLATGSQDNPWLYSVYDRLIHNTPDAQPIPGLAEEWEFVEDGMVLELRLREGVTFHDGEPFNAEAVKANIERAKTVEGSAVASSLESIESVEVVDEFTARLNLTAPDASLPLVLSDRAGAMISPAAFDNPDLDTNPVGAGAYRVTSYVPEDRAVYERYEDYWDVENSHLAGMEIALVTDPQTRLNALISGQLDAAELDPPQIEQAEAAGLNVETGQDVSFGLVQFNSALRPEFADERVIRAINHAIDREAITEGIFFGRAVPATQPMPEGYFAHNPELGPDYFEYDPELARELLAEAGYADGFAFELVTTTVPARIQTSEAIQSMLAEVGIETTVRPIAGAGPFLDAIYGTAEAEAWMLMWGGRPDPSMTLGLLYLPGSFNNPSDQTTERVQELHAKSLTTFDPEERAEVLQELSAAVVEDALPVVPLYFPEKVSVTTDRVCGMNIWTAGRPELRGVGMTAG